MPRQEKTKKQKPLSPEVMGERIAAIYGVHNPEKVGDVPALMAKYSGKEAKLYEAVINKYSIDEQQFFPPNQEEAPPAAPAAAAAAAAVGPAAAEPVAAATADEEPEAGPLKRVRPADGDSTAKHARLYLTVGVAVWVEEGAAAGAAEGGAAAEGGGGGGGHPLEAGHWAGTITKQPGEQLEIWGVQPAEGGPVVLVERGR